MHKQCMHLSNVMCYIGVHNVALSFRVYFCICVATLQVSRVDVDNNCQLLVGVELPTVTC